MERERLGSRLGFILISAGCAIGLGNVWRFPYITAQYGGALFILIYLVFLVIFGLPIMTMEFSVGRAGRSSIIGAFKNTEPKGTKWHNYGWIGIAGNYLLMMFYTVVTGWMLAYFFKMVRGDFVGLSNTKISQQFGEFTQNPTAVIGFMVLAIAIGFLICSLGLQKGVEKVTKVMMLALLAIITILAVNSIFLDGAAEGLKYYFVPDFSKLKGDRIGEIIFAALGQAFFTLSIGMGSMAIFGSYIGKERRLMGEAVSIAALDTFVAIVSGLIIIPACFAFNDGVVGAGPDLIFKILPVVFNNMPGGRIWGSFFFLFMIFAAVSTVVAVFENIISFCMDQFKLSRKKACLINLFAIIILSIPCALGFNLWSGFAPFGGDSTILDLEDFIISNNILPLGSLIYVLFCSYSKKGWGWDNFIAEANTGKGLKFPSGLKVYMKYIMPIILIALWAYGYISKFF